MNQEIWLDVPNYEGLYKVSNKGAIVSLKTKLVKRNKPEFIAYEKLLSNSNTKEGYKRVTLYKDNATDRKSFLVHRLVMSAFSNEEPQEAINHINEIKGDNRVENLEYMSRVDNNRHGTRGFRIGQSCTNGKQSKQIAQYTLDGELIKVWVSQNEIARVLGFSQGSISNCCKGLYKQSKGFNWQFI